MPLTVKALSDSPAERIAPLKILQAGDTLLVNETYLSIQGEGAHVGLPCFFIRLTACHLRCAYCDSEHSFYSGTEYIIDALIQHVQSVAQHQAFQLIQITGGEPLLQRPVHDLMTRLSDLGYTVLLETSGTLALNKVDPRVHILMDIKPKSSGEFERNRFKCFDELKPSDEVKFIIETRSDFDDAIKIIHDHQLQDCFQLLFSPTHGQLKPDLLVHWLLESGINARFQLQAHKYIWGEKTGV